MTTFTPEPLTIGADIAATVVTEAFAGLFGEFEPAPVLVAPRDEAMALSATVSIEGGWCGQVRLDCSDEFSVVATSEVLGGSPADLSVTEICDVLGELVNIIGGTFKSLLPGPSHLSLPTCGRYPAIAGTSSNAARLCRACFVWREQSFIVTVDTL